MRNWRISCVLIGAALLVAAARGRADDAAAPVPAVGHDVPGAGDVAFEPLAAESQVPRHFQLERHIFAFETEFIRTSGPVRVYAVRFPSPVTSEIEVNNTVHAEYYQPDGAGPFPGCVVLHILGGEFPLSQTLANTLARKGVAAMFVKMPYYGERRAPDSPRRMITRDPDETVAGMTQAVLDIRRAAAWLGARPEVDEDRLGVTGISLGGIMSALSAEAEPRFRKVAIYLGGGRLAESIWSLKHEEAAEFRAQWLAAGGTRESFIAKAVPVDPVTYAHLLKDRDVLMVAARHDEAIPPASTLALWEAIGTQPELVWLDSGHFSAGLYLYGEMQRLGRFFSTDEPAAQARETRQPSAGSAAAKRLD